MTARAAADPFAARRRYLTPLLAAAALAAAVASLAMGAVVIPIGDVLDVLGGRLGLPVAATDFTTDAVVWNIRVPRVLLGATVGAGLAVTGAVLQGTFRNTLADPQLLAIGPGAALGGVLGSLAGQTRGAIAGGIAAGVLVALVVRRLGRTASLEPSRFILIGVALGAALSAWVGFVVFSGDSTRVPPIEFWLLGTISGATWRALGTAVVVVAIGLAGLLAASRTLDVLSLGESEARHLGVDVEFVTTILMMAVGAVVGATVGAVGVVGFVGLLVPHLVRRLTGPVHRHVLLGSVFGGALFVVAADLVARTAASPIEIPVGLVTAAVGGPFFIWLIHRAGYA